LLFSLVLLALVLIILLALLLACRTHLLCDFPFHPWEDCKYKQEEEQVEEQEEAQKD